MSDDRAAESIVAEVATEIHTELERLGQCEGLQLSGVETRLLELLRRVKLGVLRAASKVLGTGYRGRELACECGGVLRFVDHRRRTILTLLGDLVLERAYYWCSRCGASHVPLDERLGLDGAGQSPGVVATTLLMCALHPNAHAMNVLDELGVPHVSVKESQRIVLEAGQGIVAARDAEARTWNDERVVPSEDVRRRPPERLAVLMDGTTVHTDGDWHEVKVGTFYPFDRRGEATGEKGCVATFEGIGPFRRLWDTEAQRWHLADAPVVVALCDGSSWTWNTVAEFCPEHTVPLLDFYHATEHLWELAHAIWGQGSSRAKEWVETQKTRLCEGHLDDFFDDLRQWAGAEAYREAAEAQLRYFEGNRERLGYAEALARGYPIGSGMVEAACKTLIGLREKQPGMRWRKRMAEVIGHLRCIYFSGRWASFRARWIERASLVA
jgi:hypothetical protein